jgi:hypothetical protein
MLSSQPREGCQCTNHFLDQEIVDKLDLSVSGRLEGMIKNNTICP